MLSLTIYSRPGCHLCDEMKALVRRIQGLSQAPITIDEIDISTDPELESRFGLEIPVLMLNGRKIAKYRISEAALARALATSAGSGREAG
jgi:glutaredoxin